MIRWQRWTVRSQIQQAGKLVAVWQSPVACYAAICEAACYVAVSQRICCRKSVSPGLRAKAACVF